MFGLRAARYKKRRNAGSKDILARGRGVETNSFWMKMESSCRRARGHEEWMLTSAPRNSRADFGSFDGLNSLDDAFTMLL